MRMLTYNTQLKKLALPEYGRNVQRMVDRCLTIEDRDERTACAHTIVRTMAALVPADGDPEEHRRKLWDHLAIMSGFALDIDWPYEVVKQDALGTAPQPIQSFPSQIRHRQYGKSLEAMIEVTSKMEASPEREALVLLLANQMKKMMLAVNPDGVDDERIFKDLRMLSHGELNLRAEETPLLDYKMMPAPSKKKKKK